MTSNILSYLDQLQVSVYHYPSSSSIKEGGNKQICLRINWVVTESVHIHIETIHTTGSTPNALGKTFYTCGGTKKHVCMYSV